MGLASVRGARRHPPAPSARATGDSRHNSRYFLDTLPVAHAPTAGMRGYARHAPSSRRHHAPQSVRASRWRAVTWGAIRREAQTSGFARSAGHRDRRRSRSHCPRARSNALVPELVPSSGPIVRECYLHADAERVLSVVESRPAVPTSHTGGNGNSACTGLRDDHTSRCNV